MATLRTDTRLPAFDPLNTLVFYGTHLPKKVTIPYNASEERRKTASLRANRGPEPVDTTTGMLE